jgi:hypothetical protein
MRFALQRTLNRNWADVQASHGFAVANFTAYTIPPPNLPNGEFPWGTYQAETTDMLKVLGDDETLRGFAMIDNTARWWGAGNPMLVLNVYADSDETLAAMMKHITELAGTPGRSRAQFVDVGHPNDRGKVALKKLGFDTVAFAYISGAGGQTPTLRNLEFQTTKGNLPGLVAMTRMSKAGLPLPEDLEKKITGFLSPGGREEAPGIALSKAAAIVRRTGVPVRPATAPPGGVGPAAAGAGPPAGGRRRRTVRRRKTRKSRRQVKSRY